MFRGQLATLDAAAAAVPKLQMVTCCLEHNNTALHDIPT
jgi:hypothetical protein